MPGPRAAGRAAWRVQAFCLRQNLGGGGIHFRRAFISNGVPAGRQPCGVVLPWSTWAMMATFLKCSFCIVLFSFFYGKAMPGPRAAGRAAWRVQAFCLRQNLGGGGIHFRRAFISNGVPAGRQPCGVVLPWSTWAMMATFLKCSFCISSISFSLWQGHAGPRTAGRTWRRINTRNLPAGCPIPAAGRDLHTVLHYMPFSRFLQAIPPGFFKKNRRILQFLWKSARRSAVAPPFPIIFPVFPRSNTSPKTSRRHAAGFGGSYIDAALRLLL